jgi:hypothetical protein
MGCANGAGVDVAAADVLAGESLGGTSGWAH